MTLRADKYPNGDFFIPDIFGNSAFKNDMASMEHPIFTLSKKKDMRNLEYKNGDITITIKPTTDGLPTIFDKDILLYCGSLLMKEINAGRIPPRTLRISSHDLLISTQRLTNGIAYRNLKKALERLKGVTIKTNIKTNKREQINSFGLIESYEIIESSKIKDRMVRLEITLSEWFYNSIVGKEVLTISREYFRLGKPIERRIYEIARKHCGQSPEWEIGLIKLMEKTGSKSTLRLFRSFVKKIAEENHLPDYNIKFNGKNDRIHFTQKRKEETDKRQTEFVFDNELPSIRFETIERAREITRKAGTGWDFEHLHREFTHSLVGGFRPDKVDGAFINFVKKKVKTWA